MLKALKETYGKAIQRFRRMQEHKRMNKQKQILEDMALKLLNLRTVQLDEIDLEELEQASDIVTTLYEENCK